MRLLIKEDHRSPVVALSILLSGGSASEGSKLGSGITHLLEHMIFKGTDKYPPGEIERVIKSYGGEINGFTTHDYTGYKIVVLKEGVDPILNIVKEMLTAPSFDKDELEREKEVILREMDLGEDDPGRKVSNLLWQTAYLRHPYRVPVIGYRELLKNISREDLIIYFNQHYVPQNIIISIAGDIEEEEIFLKANELFGQIPRRTEIPIFREEEPLQLGTRFIEEEANIEGAYLSIGFHSTSVLDKDLFAMDLLAKILGDGESSRLFNRLINKQKLAYSVSCYNYTPRDKGLLVVRAVLDEGYIDGTVDTILDEINKIKNNGIKSEELIKAKNLLLSDYIFAKERLDYQADDLAINTLLTGKPDFSKEYIERIKEIDTGDIRIVANKYLTPENMSAAILRPEKEEALTDKKIGVEEKRFENFKLKNGLDVLILEDHSLPCIWIYTLFKGGVRVENEKNNGISKLLSEMLLKGTKRRTVEEIMQGVESKGGALGAFSENNSLGISLRILKGNRDFALELVSDMLQNPQLPERELEIEKTKLLGAIDMQDNSIFNQAHRLLKETIFLSHPYRFQTIGKRETVEKLSREDILEFYNKLVSPKNCVLAVAGDFERDEIIKLITGYFESWSDRGYTESSVPQETIQLEPRSLMKEVPKKEAIILLGFPGISVYNSDRYALEVLLGIISGGGGRLYQSLREESGLAYSVGGFSVLGIDPGHIVLYALVSPENIEKAKELLFKELKLLLEEASADEEINRAKKYLKGMFWVNNQPSSNLLFISGLDHLYGLGFENYKSYSEEVDRVTTQDIKRVADKYLDLKKYSLIVLSPK